MQARTWLSPGHLQLLVIDRYELQMPGKLPGDQAAQLSNTKASWDGRGTNTHPL